AVDLVGEDDVGEQGTGAELEPALGLVVDGNAQDVRREEVARELDAAERAPQRARQRASQGRLADPGNILDEQVPPRQKRRHRQPDGLRLAANHPGDVVFDAEKGADRLLAGGATRDRQGSHFSQYSSAARSMASARPEGASGPRARSARPTRARVRARRGRPRSPPWTRSPGARAHRRCTTSPLRVWITTTSPGRGSAHGITRTRAPTGTVGSMD